MQDGFCLCMYMIPKLERLQKVDANKGIVVLPAVYSASHSEEEWNGLTQMTIYRSLQSLIFNAAVIIISSRLHGEIVVNPTEVLSVNNTDVDSSVYTGAPLIVGWTKCSWQDIVSPIQRQSFLCLLTIGRFLQQGLGVPTNTFSTSDSNHKLNMSLPVLSGSYCMLTTNN